MHTTTHDMSNIYSVNADRVDTSCYCHARIKQIHMYTAAVSAFRKPTNINSNTDRPSAGSSKPGARSTNNILLLSWGHFIDSHPMV